MSSRTEPLLRHLRAALDRRQMSVAELARVASLDRARLRRTLKGTEELTVDELMAIASTMELTPEDLGLKGMPDVPDAEPDLIVAPPPFQPVVDRWGNQPSQLFAIAFEFGIDFVFSADANELGGSGVPDAVLAKHRDRDLVIRLDAAYHRHNDPRPGPDVIRLKLGFDRLVDCAFPWSAIRQVTLFPAIPQAQNAPPPEPKRPHLRLVE